MRGLEGGATIRCPPEDCARRWGPDGWIRDPECGKRRPGVRPDYCDQRNPLRWEGKKGRNGGGGEGRAEGLEAARRAVWEM